MNAKKRSRVAQAARLLSPHLTGRDVLEIACGTADFSLAAAETARSVTAIDLDDCRLSPAVLYNALGHLTAILPEVLSEALRVLRPGGALLICSSFSLDKTAMEEKLLPLLSERGLPFSRREEGPFRILEIFR